MTADRSPKHRATRLPPRPILVVVGLFMVAVVVTLAHVQRLQSNLMSKQALQSAKLFSDALTEFRKFYTSEVVERVRSQGIEVTHDYRLHDGAIPLPATLSMIIGNRIGELESGGESRLYSAYPFPWRGEQGGIFAREAWEALTRNPEEPFYRFETLGGREVLRYATADLMRPGCIDCHNTHPDTPKDDWKVGDVRGVLEVITPLDSTLAASRSGLVNTAILMLLMATTGLVILGRVMSNLRRKMHAEIRAKTPEGGSQTPVVVLTARVFEEDKWSANAGADAFVIKPLPEEPIWEVMEWLLDLKFVREVEVADEQVQAREFTREDLAGLGTDIVTAIREAVENADLEAASGLLDPLEQDHGELVAHLRTLMDAFDFDGLLELIGGVDS